MHNIELLTIVMAGFIIGFGHCIGMCGGIVIAYSSAKIDQTTPWIRSTISHLTYNFGRVTTYTIMGAIFGLLGKAVAFTMTTKGILFVVAGVLMILAGLSLIGGIKFLNSANWSISKNGWFQASFRKLIASKNLSSFYALGLLNGLIPCGPVYAFAIAAASTASPLYGALVMAAFGIATIPGLFFLASITKFIQKGNLRNIMLKVGAVLVMLYGAWTLFKGYNFIAHPEKMQHKMEKMQHKMEKMQQSKKIH